MAIPTRVRARINTRGWYLPAPTVLKLEYRMVDTIRNVSQAVNTIRPIPRAIESIEKLRPPREKLTSVATSGTGQKCAIAARSAAPAGIGIPTNAFLSILGFFK